MTPTAAPLDLAPARFPARRRHLSRIAAAVLLVGAMVFATVLIALHGETRNKAEAFDLARATLAQLDARIAAQVEIFLEPAARLSRLGHAALQVEPGTQGALDALAPPVERFALSAMAEYRQVANISFGDDSGSFVMYRREADGSVSTRIIERGHGEARFTWLRRSPQGLVLGREAAPDDGYDPRQRGWYRDARRTEGTSWSDVYIFFSDRRVGTTASKADTYGEREVVVGIDMRVSRLSELLASLEVPGDGTTMIVDARGRLVAHEEPARVVDTVDGEQVPRHIDALDDRVVARAYARQRVEGEGARLLDVDGERFVASTRSLAARVGRNWSVLTVASERELAGFTVRNRRGNLVLAGILLLLGSLLGWLFVRQGRQADKRFVGLLGDARQRVAHEQAVARLASSTRAAASDDTLRDQVELLAETAGVRRVSVWGYDDARCELYCRRCYDRENASHTQGFVLAHDHYAALIAALTYSSELDIADAANDSRSAALYENYLAGAGCDALLAVPLRNGRELVGAVFLEHDSPERTGSERALELARALARTLEQHASAAARATATPTPRPARARRPIDDSRRVATLGAQRSERLNATLGGGRGETFDPAAVLCMQLFDRTLEAAPTSSAAAFEVLVQRIEALSERQGIDYMKLVGDTLTCVSGLRPDTRDHACHNVADLAIATRAQCARIFTEGDRRITFRIGLDTGPVAGAAFGRDGKLFNVWGDTLRSATEMASSADNGAIHASAAVYEALVNEYMFVARGRYYVPGIGELATFALTSRL